MHVSFIDWIRLANGEAKCATRDCSRYVEEISHREKVNQSKCTRAW